jgi:uncharacterized protein with PIN domain
MPDIQTSPTFRCAECGARLLEVRDRPESRAHNLRCPTCDRDLLDQDREAAHERQMEKWARAYDELNGAPESDEDR